MNQQELRNALAAKQGVVTLSREALGPSIGTFLDTHFKGQPVVISDAVVEPTDGPGGAVMITGRATIFNVADLPVTARLTADGANGVTTVLEYKMRSSSPGPAEWTFKKSFPDLPAVWNYETGYPIDDSGIDLTSLQKPYVESLALYDTFLVVASSAYNDANLDVRLESGVNLVSKMLPMGMAGVLEHAVSAAPSLSLQGAIHVPRDTSVTLPRLPTELFYDRPDAPGVHITAPMPLDFKAGNLVFDQAALRIYTPLSQAWMDANPTYQPAHGYTARLSIPSADLTVNLCAQLQWGLPRVYLNARCEGVTLENLAKLVDLAGGDGLSASLPDELQGAVEKLGQLELMYVGLVLSSMGSAPTVELVSFTVGMPSLTWKIWGDHLIVQSISCRFDVRNPFDSATRKVFVTVSGTLEIEGVALSVSAMSRNGFSVFAFVDGMSIPIERLFKKLAPGVPSPGDLSVGFLSVVVAPGRFYGTQMLLASGSKPLTIPAGKDGITISDIVVDLTYPSGGPVGGALSGTAALGDDLRLSASYVIPGDITLRGMFHDIKLLKVIGGVCNLVGAMPKGFDIALSTASLLVQKKGDNYVLQLGATVDAFGSCVFEARRIGAQWGFAAGMDLAAGKLSAIPGLGALKAIEDFVNLQKLMLVVSSFDSTSFQFPSLAQFNTPQLGSKNIALPASAGGVTAGLMVFAEWQLDPGDKTHNLVMKLLGLGATQQATLQIATDPAKESKLFFAQKAKIQGQPFDYKLGVVLQNGKPGMFLTGSLTTKIQGQPQIFDTTAMFVPTGMFLSGTMRGSAPVDCKVFKLANLAVQIGVNWGGIPSLGVTATILVQNFSSHVALFFDSTNPAQSLIAGSISDLTLKDVADTMLGGAAPSTIDGALKTVSIKGTQRFKIPGSLAAALDGRDIAKVSAAFSSSAKVQIPAATEQVLLSTGKKGEAWHLTDMGKMRHYALSRVGSEIEVSVEAQLYFAPQATMIGSIRFPQGYYLNCAVELFGFGASATVEIVQSKGLSIEAQMDTIVIGNEDVFVISAAKGQGGPELSVSTMARPENPVEALRQPHIYINGRARLLGIEYVAYARVSVDGVQLEMKGPLAPGAEFDLEAKFGTKELVIDGDVNVGIGTVNLGDLGKVTVNTDVEGSLGARVSGQSIAIAIEGSFEFMGSELAIARFSLDAKPDALAKLATTMTDKVEQKLRDYFKDATRWTAAIKSGVVEGVADPEKVLRDVFKKSDAEAKELAKGATSAANDVSKTTKKTTKKLKKKGKKLF